MIIRGLHAEDPRLSTAILGYPQLTTAPHPPRGFSSNAESRNGALVKVNGYGKRLTANGKRPSSDPICSVANAAPPGVGADPIQGQTRHLESGGRRVGLAQSAAVPIDIKSS